MQRSNLLDLDIIGKNFGWNFINSNSIKSLLEYYVGAETSAYSYKDLTQDIAYIIQNDYGSHNVKPFIQMLTQKLQRPNY